MSNFRTFETADTRGQHVVITDAKTLDAAQMSGRWIKTQTPVDIER